MARKVLYIQGVTTMGGAHHSLIGLAKHLNRLKYIPIVVTSKEGEFTESLKSANIDYTQAKQDALGISNIAGNTNRSLSTNAAQFQGREQARLANLQDAVGGISQQENNARSSLNMQRGQYEQSKALDTAGRLAQNRINNQQNASNARGFERDLFANLTQVGSSFNTYAEIQKEIQNNKELQNFYTTQGLALINSRTSDFQLSPDIVERLKSGKATIDDLVQVKIKVDSKK